MTFSFDAWKDGKVASTTVDFPIKPPQTEEEEASSRSREAELHNLLSRTIDYSGLDDPKATLIDELDRLSRVYRVTFEVNSEAFKMEKLKYDGTTGPVENYPICSERVLPPMKTSLQKVLTKILERVPAPSGAMFLLRKEVIEITTERAFRAEMGLPAQKCPEPGQPVERLLPLVSDDVRKTPLASVLGDFAADTSFSIVIDARVKEKAGVKVSARLANVPLDIALRVLADMAGLSVVRMGNVFYITSPENAVKLQPAKKKGGRGRYGRHG